MKNYILLRTKISGYFSSIFMKQLISRMAQTATDATIKTAKKELRKSMAEKLGKISQESIEQQSKEVYNKIFSAPWYANSHRVSVYVNTSGEIMTDAVVLKLLEDKKEVFIPMFIKGDKIMKMLRLPSETEFKGLTTTLWNIRQPEQDCKWSHYFETGPLDVVLMPGVAFTEQGSRLGHGMGFYDRFLHDHHERFGKFPITAALALQEQIIDQLPIHEFDVTVDNVLKT